MRTTMVMKSERMDVLLQSSPTPPSLIPVALILD
jgi:hypothetical protein